MRWTISDVLVVSSVALGASGLAQAQTPHTPDRSAISIQDYGAVPDGSSDSTVAINAAISAARLQGRSVIVPHGTFRHKGFSLDGVSMSGKGLGSILFAPDPNNSNIYLRGYRPSLTDVTVKVRSSIRDSKNFGVYVDGADNFLIESITVDGGNAGGIYNFGGHDGRIVHNLVQNTLADAIHNTRGAYNIVIADNIVRHSGDDMIAVVSYSDQTVSHNILIANNVLTDSDGGRGVAVEGGRDITIRSNKVERTACCAGIYLASESQGSWNFQNVRNIVVSDNLLADNSGPTRHGAIMMYTNRQPPGFDHSLRNISLQRNTILRARHDAINMAGAINGVALIDNSIVNPAENGIVSTAVNVSCAGNILDGLPIATSPYGTSRAKVEVTGSTLKYLPDAAFGAGPIGEESSRN